MRLPRLQSAVRYVNPSGSFALAFQAYWQKLLEAIEGQETAQDAILETLTIASAEMPDIPSITIAADFAGTVEPGQLPRNIMATRLQGGVDVTTDSAWSYVVDSGSITATIGASTGVLNITALGSTSVLTISSVYGGVTKSRTVTVTKQNGAAPSVGGGGTGTSASDTTFASFNSATMATVSDVLTVTTGSGGIVDLAAPLSVTTAEAAPIGSFDVKLIWQWDSTGGGVWVDLGTEVASDPDCEVDLGVDYEMTPGAVTVPYQKTGLGAATSQKFRLQARNASGTRVMYLSGTASAVGS